MSTKLLTTQQAAQMIGFTDARLRQLISIGKARPKARIGNSWVFSLAEVNRLCARRKAGRMGKGIAVIV